MTDHPDPAERLELDAQDQIVAGLLGRYIQRRETDQPPALHELLAVAAEFGDSAVQALRTVVAFYEAMRHDETRTR